MDKGGNSQDIQVTRDGCGCVIVTSGPQDARRTARQPCETHKGRSRRDAPGGWAHDTSCESEFVEGAYAWTACRCEERSKALQRTAQMHRAQADAVHAAHCCARHGCKYSAGDELCGVRAGRVEQIYPCEFCGMEDDEHKDCVPLNRQEREELERLRHLAAIPTDPAPALTCGTCYGSGEANGRDCTSCSIRAKRCTSCDHLASFHQPEGCWYSVTVGTVDANTVCPCTATFAASCFEKTLEAKP